MSSGRTKTPAERRAAGRVLVPQIWLTAEEHAALTLIVESGAAENKTRAIGQALLREARRIERALAKATSR